jgi:hypothetical protein
MMFHGWQLPERRHYVTQLRYRASPSETRHRNHGTAGRNGQEHRQHCKADAALRFVEEAVVHLRKLDRRWRVSTRQGRHARRCVVADRPGMAGLLSSYRSPGVCATGEPCGLQSARRVERRRPQQRRRRRCERSLAKLARRARRTRQCSRALRLRCQVPGLAPCRHSTSVSELRRQRAMRRADAARQIRNWTLRRTSFAVDRRADPPSAESVQAGGVRISVCEAVG